MMAQRPAKQGTNRRKPIKKECMTAGGRHSARDRRPPRAARWGRCRRSRWVRVGRWEQGACVRGAERCARAARERGRRFAGVPAAARPGDTALAAAAAVPGLAAPASSLCCWPRALRPLALSDSSLPRRPLLESPIRLARHSSREPPHGGMRRSGAPTRHKRAA